jgi:hypothetical protein
MVTVHSREVMVDDIQMFYREAREQYLFSCIVNITEACDLEMLLR